MTAKALNRALPTLEPEQVATWREVGKGAPVTQAAAVLEAVLGDRPRDVTSALLLADATLAQALGWSHVLPLLALGLKRGDVRTTGEALGLTCHRAIGTTAAEATHQAINLTRRAARLKAIAPTALTSLRSNRGARRLCDRLVAFRGAREVTRRDTFRLYGI